MRLAARARPAASVGLTSLAALALFLLAGQSRALSGQTRTMAGGVANGGAGDGLTVYGHADYDWTIRPLDGEPIDLEAFRGDVLMINLWASWCTPCIREMETIERLGERLADTDVTFLIVAAEGERAVRRHLRRHSYDLPIYLEVDPIPAAFGLRGLPTSWIVDRQGRILVRRHGEAVWDTDEVERFARSLVAGEASAADAATVDAVPAIPTPAPSAPATARTTRPAPPG